MQALITHVLGARPNFMKAAPVIRALALAGHEQMLIHTGQHYDARMSDVFFTDLGLPDPDVNLRVGSDGRGIADTNVRPGIGLVADVGIARSERLLKVRRTTSVGAETCVIGPNNER